MVETPSQIALSKQSSRARVARSEDGERAAVRASARPGAADDSLRTARIAAEAALEKKGEEVLLIDLRERSSYADFLVLSSGASDRQLEAIADEVWKALEAEGHRLVGKEGGGAGRWLLLDFGDVVVHVFHQDERGHYDLEGLWADAPQTRVEPRPVAAAGHSPAPAP
jgi:ribosome-associated protein